MNVIAPTSDATGATQTPTASVAASQQQTLDYDSFLRLLVEQMKNQDPLEPVSETDYIAQLATFSNVEQNIITNERLLALATTNALSDAQALIGRTIETPDGISGTVERVQIAEGQIYATLAGGDIVVVGDGIEVS